MVGRFLIMASEQVCPMGINTLLTKLFGNTDSAQAGSFPPEFMTGIKAFIALVEQEYNVSFTSAFLNGSHLRPYLIVSLTEKGAEAKQEQEQKQQKNAEIEKFVKIFKDGAAGAKFGALRRAVQAMEQSNSSDESLVHLADLCLEVNPDLRQRLPDNIWEGVPLKTQPTLP